MRKVLFKKIDEKTIECLACNHYCKIVDGETGICGVRKNESGKLKLLTENLLFSYAVDPIEKKPLYHFLPGTSIFSFGSPGCNFRCEFCQNWELSQSTKVSKDVKVPFNINPEKITPEEIVEFCIKKKIPSIAYTYNEPSISFEFNYKVALLAKENGLKNVYVTNGYYSKEQLKKWVGILDAANIDLKSFSEKFYQKICGAKLAPVLKNIEETFKLGIWVEITTLVIPKENDSDEELSRIARFIASISKDIPWHISAFHPDYKMLNKKETPLETMIKAYKIGKSEGLNYVYLGNVGVDGLSDTSCPKCGKVLIKRWWNSVKKIYSKDGKCSKCRETLAGVWR